MAQVFPAINELDDHPIDLTVADLQTLEALVALDDSWSVYVQPLIGWEQPDFVVSHPDYGICAIEIRDWRQSDCRLALDGHIEVRDGDHWSAVVGSPMADATRHRQAILDALQAEHGSPAGETVRGVVILPNCSTAQACALLRRPHMFGHENWVKVWGGQALIDGIACVVSGSPRPIRRPVSPVSLDLLHRNCTNGEIEHLSATNF